MTAYDHLKGVKALIESGDPLGAKFHLRDLQDAGKVTFSESLKGLSKEERAAMVHAEQDAIFKGAA